MNVVVDSDGENIEIRVVIGHDEDEPRKYEVEHLLRRAIARLGIHATQMPVIKLPKGKK